MKFILYTLSAAFLLILAQNVHAQDQIHKKNKEVIDCKVREIGTEEIKYSLPDYPSDLLFAIDKDNVDKVTFSNGKEMSFQREMTNPENYLDNKKNAIKVDFLSPLTGNTTLFYERSLKPGRSLEAGLGIIGLGLDPDDWNAAGAFVRFAPKFIKSPDYYLKGMRYAHILKGAYVKPEILFGYYARDFNEWYWDGFDEYYSTERKNVFTGAILLNVGKQWVFDNAFLVDFHFGIGYGFDNINDNYYYEGYHYGFIMASNEVPFSFSAGLKIGGLFK